MSTGLNALYSHGISHHLTYEMLEWEPAWRQIFHVKNTSDRIVDGQTYQPYGLPQFRIPGGRVVMDQIRQSFSKRWVIRSFGLGDQVAKEDEEDDLYGVYSRVLPKKTGLMAQSFQDLLEIDNANFFIVNGFGAGTVGMADGVPLFSLSHPTSLALSSVLVANRPTVAADLSIASAQAMATALRTQKRPNNVTVIHNELRCIVIHPSLHYVAEQIYHGPWERGTADRNMNVLKSDNVDIIEWPYLTVNGATGTNNGFFGVAKEHFLYFYMRSAYDVYVDFDVNTLSRIFTCDMRFDQGALDFRGTWGSPGL